MTKQNEITSIYSILAIIINIIAVIVSGLALSLGWNTFVLRLFDLPNMTLWTAVGLMIMFELVRINLARDSYYSLKVTEELGYSDSESRLIMSLTGLTYALVTWAGIWIVTML